MQIVLLICVFFSCVNYLRVKQGKPTQNNPTDSSVVVADTQKTDAAINQLSDSTMQISDTNNAKTDTANMEADTSTRKMRLSPNAITSIVDYSAKDSVEFDLANSMSKMYNQTELNYDDINLRSNFVEINFSKKELFSRGTTDTAGKLQGTPVFKQGSYEFKSHELQYNFDTKKGLIRNVITQEGESYLHGELVKKKEDNTSYIYKGKYTTCNLECPHFEIAFDKAKVIPNDKIITGPFFIRVAGVPINPIPVPFGFFPNSNKRRNGLILPKYGMSDFLNKGPYLRDIGYYFAIKDKMDYAITATIYMRGAWGAKIVSNYAKRYKFTGRYAIEYNFTPSGEKTVTPEDEKKYNHQQAYKVKHDISISWTHQQDRKAHPTNNFSANVDFKTSTFAKNNIQPDINAYTQSKAMSVINFSTSFKSRYSLGINAELSQDLVQGDLDMKLPQINFGISQFYPFRRKQVVGKLRWYENISMQYTMDFQNIINTKDSILIHHFKNAFDNMRTGISHNIPIKSTIKILKYINWENSATLQETWQIKGVKQSWGAYDTTLRTNIHKDTVYGFYAAHNLSLRSGLSTTLYGMYTMKKGRVYAFRHTLTPSVDFTYTPALNKLLFNTYNRDVIGKFYDSIHGTYYDSIVGTKAERYSYIDGSLYGTPAYKSSGKINFSISNKLEMKIRSRKKNEEDEETFKKVTLLENLTIATGYDLLADSLNWDYLSLSGRTILFKQINVDFRLAFDPYTIGEEGIRIKETEWKSSNHKRLFRLSNTGVNLSLSYNIDNNLFNKNKEKEKKKSPSGFGDWNVNVSYTFGYNTNDNAEYYRNQRFVDTAIPKYIKTFSNSFSISGAFALTPKWSFRFQSGYNITQKAITPSEFTVERDLHCWVISFKWRPFGYRGFEFGIRAKANILRDVHHEQKRDYPD